MPNPKILIISSFSNSLVNFRGDFIAYLIAHHFEVFCAAPEFEKKKTVRTLHGMGAKTLTYPLQRNGLNPIKDVQSISALKKMMQQHQIDLVFPYTIKPVIYGSIAARQLNIPVIALITGLGFTFSAVNLKSKILQRISQMLYREALRKTAVTIFQNTDDRQLFLEKHILTKKQQTAVVNGSGIHLERFPFRVHQKQVGDPIKFIIIGRLIKEKGVELFLQAAETLKPLYPNAEFHLVGAPPPDNSSGISYGVLDALQIKGIIIYHEVQADVVPFLTEADVFVLPSYYREGVPRSILEALSIGMPIITTNMPGCKETVVPKQNGFLIPPQELDPLLEAITFFLDKPEQIALMGKASRALAEQKFDVAIINQNLIDILQTHVEMG
ncbi:glycosyltransferase family 4 protein [Arenibacter sp. GZD96]|uniref:glycosyltransferase family 4 protein n=1 Tax=Aurantibrevibacter litoralis TaxID=3106030 RepID=UPI002AFFA7CD|nr:glycosyltransferase family 4 protein [Arenibacter sp. GZD-96]MEA1787682.1 glycosyltransferase family 4 protein [Arenibacter sp. GZD-96]